MNYLEYIPKELLYSIIKYSDRDGILAIDKLDLGLNYQEMFIFKFPLIYSNIKHVMMNLTINWNQLYIDFSQLALVYSIRDLSIGYVNTSFLKSGNPGILSDIRMETLDILYSLKLYNKYPLFYNKIELLPQSAVTKFIFLQELKFYEKIKHQYPSKFSEFIDQYLRTGKIMSELIEQDIIYLKFNFNLYYILLNEYSDTLLLITLGLNYVIDYILKFNEKNIHDYYIKSYVYLILKKIIEKIGISNINLISNITDIVPIIEDVYPELVGNFPKPVARRLFF